MNETLRSRVAEAIERFNEALFEVEKDETCDSLDNLAESADHLMRAVGRVLIEAKEQLGENKS